MQTVTRAGPPRLSPYLLAGLTLGLRAQEPVRPAAEQPVPLQPLAQQTRRLEAALGYLGQPLPPADRSAINDAIAMSDEPAAVARLQEVLDRHVLAGVHISPESRVKVAQGSARPELVQGGTRLFLVKVLNDAHVTAPLTVQSPNSGRVYIQGRGSPEPRMVLTDKDARERWAELSIYTESPMRARLSGLAIEYAILQVYSRDVGQRSAIISFNVGQGIAGHRLPQQHRRAVHGRAGASRCVCACSTSTASRRPASFLVRDDAARIYPNIAKRLAPDFFFQPQVYRADGQTIDLPAGAFTSTCRAVLNTCRKRNACRCRDRRRCSSGWRAGSIRRATAGTRATITSTRPAARTTKTRPRGCCRKTCGRRSTARR